MGEEGPNKSRNGGKEIGMEGGGRVKEGRTVGRREQGRVGEKGPKGWVKKGLTRVGMEGRR